VELQEKHFVAKDEVEYPSGCHRFDVQNVVLRYLKGVRYKVQGKVSILRIPFTSQTYAACCVMIRGIRLSTGLSMTSRRYPSRLLTLAHTIWLVWRTFKMCSCYLVTLSRKVHLNLSTGVSGCDWRVCI
jgi:hypothetical protein